MASNFQLQTAQKTSVVVEEAYVGRTGWRNVAGNRRREERLAVDEREVVDFPRLMNEKTQFRLGIRTRNLFESLGRNSNGCAHAAAPGSAIAIAASAASMGMTVGLARI